MSRNWQGIALHALTTVVARLKSLPNGVVTWVPAALASSGILFWHASADVETVVPRVICVLALLAAVLFASKTRSCLGVVSFAGVAVLFNPFVANMLSRIVVCGLYLAFITTLLLCLLVLEVVARKPALVLVESRPPSARAA